MKSESWGQNESNWKFCTTAQELLIQATSVSWWHVQSHEIPHCHNSISCSHSRRTGLVWTCWWWLFPLFLPRSQHSVCAWNGNYSFSLHAETSSADPGKWNTANEAANSLKKKKKMEFAGRETKEWSGLTCGTLLSHYYNWTLSVLKFWECLQVKLYNECQNKEFILKWTMF